MCNETPTPDLFDRYLRLLRIARHKPSYNALAELVAAHLKCVPFENVSKLYYRKHDGLRRLLGLERFLDGIERYNFGGTCYPNNYYFHLLLVHLGYEVKLCGAGMANPDVHLVNIVKLDGHEYLVDGGYAAPFLTPLPRDLAEDYVIELGRDRYVLRPQDSEGRSRIDLYRDGQLKHGYTAKPIPRTIEHFARVIEHSYTDEATFMNALLLVRFFPGRSLVIHNLNLIESQGTESQVQPLADRDELVHMVEKHFAIPAAIAAEAIGELGEFGDAWN